MGELATLTTRLVATKCCANVGEHLLETKARFIFSLCRGYLFPCFPCCPVYCGYCPVFSPFSRVPGGFPCPGGTTTQRRREREQESLLIHSAKMATLGELSAGVAHEIRSPLSAIAVTAELLARTETPCPTNQGSVAGHAVRIKEGVAHIAKIVADLQSSPEDTTRDPMSRKGDATLFAQEHQSGHATAGWGKRVASPFIRWFSRVSPADTGKG